MSPLTAMRFPPCKRYTTTRRGIFFLKLNRVRRRARKRMYGASLIFMERTRDASPRLRIIQKIVWRKPVKKSNMPFIAMLPPTNGISLICVSRAWSSPSFGVSLQRNFVRRLLQRKRESFSSEWRNKF